MDEVVVGREQGQVMTYAELRQQGVDRAHLNACTTADVAQLRSVDVILPVRAEERQRGKTLDDVFACTRSGETLKQFLQNEPRGHDDLVALEGVAQRANLRGGGDLVPTEGEGPDAGVDEQCHPRDRSAL